MTISKLKLNETMFIGNARVTKIYNYEFQTVMGRSNGVSRYAYLVQTDSKRFTTPSAREARQKAEKWS